MYTRAVSVWMEAAGRRCGHGWHARRAKMGAVTPEGAAAFDQDGCQHAKAIAEGIQVARPVNPGMFETGNLSDAESFPGDPHMD